MIIDSTMITNELTTLRARMDSLAEAQRYYLDTTFPVSLDIIFWFLGGAIAIIVAFNIFSAVYVMTAPRRLENQIRTTTDKLTEINNFVKERFYFLALTTLKGIHVEMNELRIWEDVQVTLAFARELGDNQTINVVEIIESLLDDVEDAPPEGLLTKYFDDFSGCVTNIISLLEGTSLSKAHEVAERLGSFVGKLAEIREEKDV